MNKLILLVLLSQFLSPIRTVIRRNHVSRLNSVKFGCWNTCRFPFYDNGIEYNRCKSTELDTFWCKVQPGYSGWSVNDQVKCPRECKCNFPFLHKNILYKYCIYENNSTRPWCSTTYAFDFHPEDWTYCLEKCEPDPCAQDEVCVNTGDSFKCLKNMFRN